MCVWNSDVVVVMHMPAGVSDPGPALNDEVG